jgi:hypothetical protein
MGRYEVCTTPEPLGEDRGEALEALDAFGSAGAYRRSALARLYGGRRVRVVRSWTTSGGRFESVTRISPYPDASLTRLWPGTMEIRWTIDGTAKAAPYVLIDGTAKAAPYVLQSLPAR